MEIDDEVLSLHVTILGKAVELASDFGDQKLFSPFDFFGTRGNFGLERVSQGTSKSFITVIGVGASVNFAIRSVDVAARLIVCVGELRARLGILGICARILLAAKRTKGQN